MPFATWIMIGYFSSIPKELDEAALIDGASYLQILTEGVHPGGAARDHRRDDLRLYRVVGEFPLSARLHDLGRPAGPARSASSLRLIKGDVYNWGQIMTGALLGAAPPLIIYAFLMDYYIAGLTAGATKG